MMNKKHSIYVFLLLYDRFDLIRAPLKLRFINAVPGSTLEVQQIFNSVIVFYSSFTENQIRCTQLIKPSPDALTSFEIPCPVI